MAQVVVVRVGGRSVEVTTAPAAIGAKTLI
jgi:hypothetical protein